MPRILSRVLSLLLCLTLFCTPVLSASAAGNGSTASPKTTLASEKDEDSPGDPAPEETPELPTENASWSSTKKILVLALAAVLLLTVGSFVTLPVLQKKQRELKE